MSLSGGFNALNLAYDGAIERIKSQLPEDSELAMNVLSWIVFAQRRLTTKEMRHALAVELGTAELDLDNVLDVEDMALVCAGLVMVDEETDIIRLVHYTTQEYLERLLDKQKSDAQRNITLTCLTYLCFDTFKDGYCDGDEDYEDRLETNAFLTYAACHWGHHAYTVQAETQDLALSFLLDDELVASAAQVMSIVEDPYFDPLKDSYHLLLPSDRGSIHLVARFGLTLLLEKLLVEFKCNANSTGQAGQDGQSPLCLAAQYGHTQVARLLLKHGAEVNANVKIANGHEYHNALEAASADGNEELVQLLLENGADVHIHYDNVLKTAASCGHERVVRLLIDAGATMNTAEGTVLLSAAENGHYQVVKVLLDAGAALEADDGEALTAASKNGSYQIVKLLLDEGADFSRGTGWRALGAASEAGHKRIVELLLARGANTISQIEHAIEGASTNGHTEIVTLLLQTSRDVNLNLGFALKAAATLGHEAVVELLLAAGANTNLYKLLENDKKALIYDTVDVDDPDIADLFTEMGLRLKWHGEIYVGALEAAAEGGYERIVKMLLENGADVNIHSDYHDYRSAIEVASEKGHEQVVRLLLEHGADPTWQSNMALTLASEEGHAQIVELLLKNGAQVNAHIRSERAYLRHPLIAASNAGHESVVRLLLANGADVNIRNNTAHAPYSHALLAASSKGHESIVTLLLENGVEVDICNGDCSCSALVIASTEDHKKVFEILRKHGADINMYCDKHDRGVEVLDLERARR